MRELPDLPVRGVLPELSAALAAAGSAVLVAPPGTGKTTVVPLALAEGAPGRVVVAEPRRVAARAAARRMAALLGEPVGARVGYAVRGERRTSPDTVVEVVTTGLLLRRLHGDPELPGTAVVVVLDECHERHLDADLALAFLVEARAALRPGLRLLAASATPAAERLAALLGGAAGPAPVVRTAAAGHDVAVHWCPPPGPPAPPRADPRLSAHVAATVRRALADGPGDVLVFLPGVAEIGAVAGLLGGDRVDGTDVAVQRLHGRLAAAAQDAVLRPGGGRRVVLATAVAESSLTVPGVRAVVDAGLSRVPWTDHARGLGGLTTVAASRAQADQRAGRAGREAPGRAYRCWSAATHARLAEHAEPAVALADLTGYALDLALWGHPDGSGLALWDPPPAGAMRAAVHTLRGLGAVDGDGRVTARGRRLAAAGLHPRLARALLDGAAAVGVRRAAEVVALLADERPGDDLVAAWRRARTGGDGPWRAEVRRLTAAARAAGAADAGTGPPDDLAAGLVVGLAYPERVARARTPGGGAYLMAGGTAAELPAGSALAGLEWLAVAVADRAPGARHARIRAAAPLDAATARQAAAALLAHETTTGWADGDVVARATQRLGAIVLAERPVAAGPGEVRAAVAQGLRRDGLGLLTWTPEAVAVRARLAFARAALGEPWPDVSDAALAGGDWLDLRGVRDRAGLAALDVAAALRRLPPPAVAGRLDEVAPERLTVPAGSRARVDYTDPGAPVLAVKVQEAFGWRDVPRLAGGRVPVLLHLLSPAGRPVAVTGDLASFWATGYPRVRAELRGRYPRHPWPEDPLTAEPTRRTRPRR